MRILALEHFPCAREKERSCKGAIKDRLLNKLDIRQEAIFCCTINDKYNTDINGGGWKMNPDQLWMIPIPALAIVKSRKSSGGTLLIQFYFRSESR